MFKPGNRCAKLASEQMTGDLVSARFTSNFLDVKTFGGSHRPVLFENDVLEIQWIQVLIVRNDEVISYSRGSEGGNEDGDKFCFKIFLAAS